MWKEYQVTTEYTDGHGGTQTSSMSFIGRSPEEALEVARRYCAAHLSYLTPVEVNPESREIVIPGVRFIPKFVNVDGEQILQIERLKRPSKQYIRDILDEADDTALRDAYKKIYDDLKAGEVVMDCFYNDYWKR